SGKFIGSTPLSSTKACNFCKPFLFLVMYFVYILFSPKTNKYYVGSTDNLESRLKHHNAG
ncbi:GIY-YIG nuclease family protein, partial [Algoriphagus faecimaris]|uniref:GIY-YIG nuclease family protein n=1 Tax=Algoriphagus faecimaris TaxID=686796 RepID=UPI001F0B1C2C